ncbi:hypothetical protein [Mucilaginibacter jinjuensis]|uniref:hypothetical protein n=1 Tax=Mucilaginibacter jinjuensis TaxID=1176721 RepID=UPI003B5889DC
MKLIRYGQAGQEKPGVIIDDIRYDVSAYINDYNEAFFTNGGIEQLRALLTEKKAELIKIADDVD